MTTSHGGRREGAGRKPKPDAMVTRSYVITQKLDAWLETQSILSGNSRSEIIRMALEAHMRRLGITVPLQTRTDPLRG